VDKSQPGEDPSLSFEDGRTRIETLETHALDLHGYRAYLLRVRFQSDELQTRDSAVLRVRATNDEFVGAALAEGWRPHLFIGMNDGCCPGWGGNDRCENQLEDPTISIPLRLGACWWISDHFPGSTASGGDDPQNGDVIRSANPDFPVCLRQLAFLSTDWRSKVPDGYEGRLRGGARLFEIPRPKHLPIGEHVRRGMLYSPKVNRKLR
jgi:hypothetical protein